MGSGLDGGGRRERARLGRVRTFVDVAWRIVEAEGLDGLTMQRVADEVDAAVSAIYRYFPSKAALIAELQREAIEGLHLSWTILRGNLVARVSASRLTPRQRALCGAVAFGRFWIDAHVAHASKLALLSELLEAPGRVVPAEEGGHVVPATVRLLDACGREVDAATTAKALQPGDALRRTIVLAAALNGVLRMQKLTVWDEELFDARRLARELLHALLVGWGARPADLDAVEAEIDALAGGGMLAPPLD